MTKPVQTNPDWSAWAREQLHLSESSTSADARQAYLKRLNDEDFLPPAHLPYALAVLEGKAEAPGANEEAVWPEVGDRQRQRVEEFARRYLQIPIDDRIDQWLKLKADCRDVPALADRLDRLEPALPLDPNSLAVADPDVRELMQEASKIFVLRPFEAAQARAAFFRREAVRSEDGMARWHWAARNLKKSYPQYEILSPELIQQAILRPSRAKELSRRRAIPPESRVAKAQTAKPSAVQVNFKPPYWLLGVCAILAIAVLRAIPTSHAPPSITTEPNMFLGGDLDELRRQPRWQDNPPDPDTLLKVLYPRRTARRLREDVQKSLQRNELKPGEDGKDAGDKKNPFAPARNPPP